MAMIFLVSQAVTAGSTDNPGVEKHYESTGDQALNELGRAVRCVGDINGDGLDDLAAGEPEANNSQGQVKILSGGDGQVLHVLQPSSSFRFGLSVSPTGDLDQDGFPDVAVGAPRDSARGKIYFFSGFSGALLYTLSADTNDDDFGEALALLDDINQDGFDELIIGAPGSSVNLNDDGQVHILSGEWLAAQINGTSANTNQYFATFVGDSEREHFGEVVSNVGDVNQDGWSDCGVGVPFDDGITQSQKGKVVIFSGQWIATGQGSPVLHNIPGENDGDRFGSALDGTLDLNGDGFDDIAVGAPFNDQAASNAGRVVVFSGFDPNLPPLIERNGHVGGGLFGRSLARVGDLNDDGLAELIVGAPGDNTKGSDAGAVFILNGKNGRRIRSLYGDSSADRFGTTVASAGLADGDAFYDFAIGAPDENSNGTNAGSVYSYPGSYAVNSLDRGGEGSPSGNPPTLKVKGTFESGGDLTMTLSGGLPHQKLFLVIGFSEVCLPLDGGGLFVPAPDLLIKGLVLDANGDLVINYTLPTVSDELNSYLQAILNEAGSLASSNALRIKVLDNP